MQCRLQRKQFYILHLNYATFQKHFHIIIIFFMQYGNSNYTYHIMELIILWAIWRTDLFQCSRNGECRIGTAVNYTLSW